MRHIIKLETDKLFTNLTDQISELSKEWGGTGLVNVITNHCTIDCFCIINICAFSVSIHHS